MFLITLPSFRCLLIPDVYKRQVLANTQDMNIIEKPEPEDTPFYINNGTINVGNTNGKVILQTFSLESLVRVAEVFQGKVPM